MIFNTFWLLDQFLSLAVHKYTKKWGIEKKILKQAGVVHNIKT